MWTPLCIVGGALLAGIIGVLHYIFDSHLNNQSVSGYWTQTKSSQIEILLANAFKILYGFSAGVSLCQVVRLCLFSFHWNLTCGAGLAYHASATTFTYVHLFNSAKTHQLGIITVSDLNALLSAPSVMTLPRVNLIFQAPLVLVIIAAILASPLITIFAPSLTARQADAISRILTVPTLNLTTDGLLEDFTEEYVSPSIRTQ